MFSSLLKITTAFGCNCINTNIRDFICNDTSILLQKNWKNAVL